MKPGKDWRVALAKRLAPLGADIFAVQKALSDKGFGAYLPAQASLFAQADGTAETEELRNYLCEMAKETLGSVHRPGTSILASDVYVSEQLKKLRSLRNSQVGGIDEYQSSRTRWLFEINPVFKRMATFQAEQAALWRAQADETRKQTQAIRHAEQNRHFGSIEGDFGSAAQRADALRAALQEGVGPQGMIAAGSRRLRRFSNLAVVPIGPNWSACLCLTNASPFSGLAGGGACPIDCRIYIAESAPAQLAKLPVFPVDDGFTLRIDESIYGFHAYNSAKSLGEIALCIKIRLELLAIVFDRLSAALNHLA